MAGAIYGSLYEPDTFGSGGTAATNSSGRGTLNFHNFMSSLQNKMYTLRNELYCCEILVNDNNFIIHVFFWPFDREWVII